MQRDVVIVGGNHHNTQGVLRSLGQKGIKCIVVIHSQSESECFVIKSKYVKEGYVEKDNNSLINKLKIIAERYTEDNKPVIICTSDEASSLVDCYHDELSKLYCIPGASKQGLITAFMDKSCQISLAKELGLKIPTTWILNNTEDLVQVTYPCIVKPHSSVNGSKSDIRIFRNQEELTFFWNTTLQKPVLAQNYVEKDFEFQLLGCSLNKGNEVIIPGYTRIIRSSERTNTGVLNYQAIDFDIDIDKCQQFFRTTGYSGLFSMEFIHSKDGNNYFLEVNFRNDGNAICVTAAGVNLPYIWYLSQIGEDYDNEKAKQVHRVNVIPVFDDYFHFVRTKKIGVLKWLVDLCKADCFMDIELGDLRPLFKRILKK